MRYKPIQVTVEASKARYIMERLGMATTSGLSEVLVAHNDKTNFGEKLLVKVLASDPNVPIDTASLARSGTVWIGGRRLASSETFWSARQSRYGHKRRPAPLSESSPPRARAFSIQWAGSPYLFKEKGSGFVYASAYASVVHDKVPFLTSKEGMIDVYVTGHMEKAIMEYMEASGIHVKFGGL